MPVQLDAMESYIRGRDVEESRASVPLAGGTHRSGSRLTRLGMLYYDQQEFRPAGVVRQSQTHTDRSSYRREPLGSKRRRASNNCGSAERHPGPPQHPNALATLDRAIEIDQAICGAFQCRTGVEFDKASAHLRNLLDRCYRANRSSGARRRSNRWPKMEFQAVGTRKPRICSPYYNQ